MRWLFGASKIYLIKWFFVYYVIGTEINNISIRWFFCVPSQWNESFDRAPEGWNTCLNQTFFLLNSQWKPMLWVLKRTSSMRQFISAAQTHVWTNDFFLIFSNQSICCEYSKQHLNELILLSTRNICLNLGIENDSEFKAQNVLIC